ncbi:MAG: ABC transporter permease [Candidatus Nanopelagicales bacterium]
MIAALRYEWVRVSTIRSTKIALIITLLGAGLLGWLASTPTYSNFDETGNPVGPPTVGWWDAFAQPLLFTAILASVVAAQNIGQEYRFGLIRLTLTAFPQRAQMVSAKLISVVLTGVVFALVSYAASWVGVTLRGYPTPPPEATPVDSTYLLRGVVFLVLWSLSAWALAGLTRQTAIGIAVPVVSGFIVEQIVGGILADRAPWLQDVLPWSNATRWFAPEIIPSEGVDQHFPPVGWAAVGVFAVWVLVLVVLEIVAFLRRDA